MLSPNMATTYLPPMGERISMEEVISPTGRTITLIRS
ncbi:hypothetical protein CRD_00921 [Raphidiopsis brookii D9]|nr:hypothetical protein CRD_00921 [Raphidiopsis brookii D9]